MDEREIKVFKSINPEKIIVFHAESLSNQIRFYLNDTCYVAAVEEEDSYHVEIAEKEEKEEKSRKAFFIKKPKIIFFNAIATSLLFILSIGLFMIIRNMLLYLFCINIVFFIMESGSKFWLMTKQITPTLKSKHSAEHMMVNFLIKNNRLPQTMEEIRKSSRFSSVCGSRKSVTRITEIFIQNTITIILTIMVGKIVVYFATDSITEMYLFFLTFCLMIFIAKELVRIPKLVQPIITPIQKVLMYVMQYANTTKNVEESDIYLAYIAAKEWMKIVYPEFYKEEDTF